MLCAYGTWPVQGKEWLCSAMIHMSVALSQVNVIRFDPANATNMNCAEPGMLHVHMGSMRVNWVVARVLLEDGVVGRLLLRKQMPTTVVRLPLVFSTARIDRMAFDMIVIFSYQHPTHGPQSC